MNQILFTQHAINVNMSNNRVSFEVAFGEQLVKLPESFNDPFDLGGEVEINCVIGKFIGLGILRTSVGFWLLCIKAEDIEDG